MRPRFAIPLLLALLVPAAAHARDRWDDARDPKAKSRAQDLELAKRMYEQAETIEGTSATRRRLRRDLLQSLRQTLAGMEAETSSDPEMRFLLGHVLHDLDDDDAAIRVLSRTVAEWPDHPHVTVAYLDLAIAFARTKRPEREVEMYDLYLERQLLPRARHVALSNRAETNMKLGKLDLAIDDYREALRLQDEPLARWGLALTLDRRGDLSAAIAESVRALAMDDPVMSAFDSPNVFFVPEYERYWYYALRAAAQARTVEQPEQKKELWETAATMWATYLARATSDDPWVELARQRKTFAEAQAKAALKGKRPPPKATKPRVL